MQRHRTGATGVAMLLGVVLFAAACGTEGDPEATAGGTSGTTTTATTSTGTETGGTQTGETETGGTETSPTGTSETTDEVEPTLADGSQAAIDLVLGRLDSATQDGRSQCMVDQIGVTGQVGLQKSNRPHMLADGHDVWVVCLTGTSGPDGATLSLTDSAGTVWGQGTLSRLAVTAAERSIGFGQTGTDVRPVMVSDGSSLVPVGFSYERDGYTVTTLMMQVPASRPAGPWTISVAGPDGADSVQMDTFACQATTSTPVRPWPVRTDLRVITFVEINPWLGSPTPELAGGFTPVGHCLAAPLVYGLGWQEAVDALAAARASAGVPPADTELSFSCEAGAAGTVQWQSPVPNGDITESASLYTPIVCPPMVDVVGLTVAQAEETLAAQDVPPFTLRAEVSPQCLGPETLVTGSFPSVGDASYRANGTVLLVDLFCTPGLTGGG